MRNVHKDKILNLVDVLLQAHKEIECGIMNNNDEVIKELFENCQEAAIRIGELIEKSEGDGFVTVGYLEKYCEEIYLLYSRYPYQDMKNDEVNILNKLLLVIKNSIIDDIKVKPEVLFLPYKASMWDSLESVWLAANNDPNFEAVVMPIPYYTKNADGTFGEFHYEGMDFPEYVTITDYREYDYTENNPDVIYIHNPYDQYNYVTSIDKIYYSPELKKHTKLLVYIPYYATTGGMNDAQSLCPAYIHADYIVIQKEYFKKFYDSSIDADKFLALGSPKFDRIIHAKNSNHEIPDDWKNQLAEKTVYFYNTSITGMLNDTKSFLMKMEYVFNCFMKRPNHCLIWRPHPLMESTFHSLRKEYLPYYETLKRFFISNKVGIFDETSDITKTVSLCDAYIGDEGTSVTSLFGVSGKPIFILNNRINTLPQKDDWKGEIIKNFFIDGFDEWRITNGNQLYYSENKNYRYKYYCDLSEFKAGELYQRAIEANGKIFVCPANTQEILILKDNRIDRKLQLNETTDKVGSFLFSTRIGNYIFLVPLKYPAIVRIDTLTEEIEYFYDLNNFFIRSVDGVLRAGGCCVWKNHLILTSPTDTSVLAINSISMQVQHLSTGSLNSTGCVSAIANGSDIWMLPYCGGVITRWNIETGEVRDYMNLPEEFQCINRSHGGVCEDLPFSYAAFCEEQVILSPFWGNAFLVLDQNTGEINIWNPPFETEARKGGYYFSWMHGIFYARNDALGKWTYRYFHADSRRLYDVNIKTREFKEIEIEFDLNELRNGSSGYFNQSSWLKYVCVENAFCSLLDFVDDNIFGEKFNVEKQRLVYDEVTNNLDGTCGKRIHEFMTEKLIST